jgi:hypothetical protein
MFLPGGNTGKTGLGGNNPQTVNPMFDFQDYFSMEGTYHFRYAALTVPSDLYSRIGRIFQTGELPGNPPQNLPDNRNWLCVPAPYKNRGLILDITETYWLSGRGGWPIPIYTLPGNGGQWPTALPNMASSSSGGGSPYAGALASYDAKRPLS